MEFVVIMLFVVGALIPPLTRLVDSVAYRNRARGRADLVRAQSGRGTLAGVPVREGGASAVADPQATQSVNCAALAQVFGEDAPRMKGRAARLLHEWGVPECVVEAEDVVQDAFEKALGVQDVLDEPRAYVYRILDREVSARAQRLTRERHGERLRQAELRTALAHGRDVGATVTDRIVVRDGVRQLPRQRAVAVVATKMYGFTQEETARLTGRRLGTVGVHVARGVAALLLCLTSVAAVIAVVILGSKYLTSELSPVAVTGLGALLIRGIQMFRTWLVEPTSWRITRNSDLEVARPRRRRRHVDF